MYTKIEFYYLITMILDRSVPSDTLLRFHEMHLQKDQQCEKKEKKPQKEHFDLRRDR